MPLDPQCRELLKHLDPGWGHEDPSPDDVRRMNAETVRRFTRPSPAMDSVEELSGAPTPIRLYRPPDVSLRHALVAYVHGGGWMSGRAGVDHSCHEIAAATGCAVAGVLYRLAPDHPFPAGLDDCYAAVTWLRERVAALLGSDRSRLALVGESAGANLSAAVCLLARDRRGPRIDFQVLICPATDPCATTESRRAFATGYWATTAIIERCWRHYLADPADRDSPYAAVLRAGDLTGLPPAHIVTAEFDPLRDEGEEYARRLAAAGVPVTTKRYAGMVHGFQECDAVLEAAVTARADVAQALRAALRSRPPTAA